VTDSLHTSVDLNKDQKQHPPTRSDSSSGVISGDPLVASESDVSRGPGPEQSPTAPSLYQIAKMLHHIELSIIEGGGELTPELEFISEVTTLVRERKVDSYAGILDRCASLITEYKTKADMLYSVANSATKLTKRLKDNLKLAMDIIGTDELQGDSVRFKLKRGKPKVVIFDETVVPDKFWKVVTTRVIDLEAVSNAIQTFEDVPGAQLAETKTLNKYAAKKELK
jgi:hypothetical protein